MSTTRGDAPPVRYDVTLIGDDDLYLFNEGTHTRLYDEARRAPDPGRRRRGHALRRVGAERRATCR